MLKFKLLGTAAGGGFPQWNCACSLCAGARAGQIPPRLQLQAAVSNGNRDWFLLNASPDLRFQIESTPELQPTPEQGRRNTPIAGIVLTSADLDQVLGLLFLREFQPLTVYATALVRRILTANSFFRMMERVPNQLTWIEIHPDQPFELAGSGIVCTPIPLRSGLPHYAREFEAESGQSSIGLILESGGRRVAYTPALPEITPELLALYENCHAILVDGTFWQDEELCQTHSGTPLARAIGHIPMSGETGTLASLAGINFPRKLFVHINNTNPVLDPASLERRVVIEAGWQIAEDGWNFN